MLNKVRISDVDLNGGPALNHIFYVPFNPNEITIVEACSKFQSASSKDTLKEKDEGNAHLCLSCTLFFNTYTSLSQKTYEDVRNHIRNLYAYTNANTDKKQELKKIAFSWGSICVVGLLSNLQVKYTMFSPEGTPIRAEADITIEGNYYGEQNTLVNNQKEEQLKTYPNFDALLKQLKEGENWKGKARDSGIVKPREEL